jgi:MinD superfamily P-loop ATPase
MARTIAIASGKGGTGKTTVATSLAWVASRDGRDVSYLDCDVEEPNGAIFLKPAITAEKAIEKLVPAVTPTGCTHCGRCGEICRYGAIACLPDKTLVFPELCHSCGGCALVCPAGAIRELPRPIGTLRTGASGSVRFIEGVLNVGEAMSPPAIRAVKQAAPDADLVIIDAPPGTSCPAVESIRGCDLVILVAEPTPFGLHDLALAVEMVRAMKLPAAVVINRSDAGDGRVVDYCRKQRITVLAEIPDDRAVAEAYSRGEMISEAVREFGNRLRRLLRSIEMEKVA